MILGTGVDITEVRRLRQAVEKWGDAFLGRVFTKTELCNAKKRGSLYQHLAGRFAAKEAIFKALGNAELTWKDVEILNDKEGRPLCRILNGRAKKLDVHISISHVKTYATAFAIVTKKAQRA
ncbi:MAG: holo-ACP synthase [Candidatus Omnitrophica bacterium]|nr:holo-ACP synthase [Candidatus Omnitrophota bacterium]